MHAYPQQGRGPHVAAWAYDTAAAAATMALAGLSGRPIFVNFVTFSTKHGSTSNKAYSRLSGSRYVHANAHRLHEAIF